MPLEDRHRCEHQFPWHAAWFRIMPKDGKIHERAGSQETLDIFD